MKWLLKCLLPYKRHMSAALLCMAVFAVLSVVSIWTLKPIIDKIFVPEEIVSLEIPFFGSAEVSRVAALKLLAGFVVTIILFKGIAGFGHGYLMQFVSAKIVDDLRNRLYTNVLRLSPAFFNERKTGELISRFTNDMTVIQMTVTQSLAYIIREPVTIIGFMGLLFYLNPGLTAVSLVILPPIALLIKKLGSKIRKRTLEAQEKISDVSSILQETVSGIRIVQAFGMEDYERRRFASEGKKFLRATMKGGKYYHMSSPIMEFLGAVGIAFILIYAGYTALPGSEGAITAGEFVAFLAAVFSMYGPAKNLTRANNMMQQAKAASSRVFELLDARPEVTEQPGAPPLARMKKELRFDKVDFSYNGRDYVLKDVSFAAGKGEIIAVVGASGAGKTTLVNLIPRFYDTSSGSIFIDGIDIRKVTLESLRAQIGIVTQEVVVFNDTLANNIAYGNPDISMDKVVEAARAANAHEFIEKLPEGYLSPAGERGVSLSGGQRQRISIARAILKDPAILILDEATSALDSESENLVHEALGNLMQDRTVIVIAHRLSTVQKADNILVLDEGRIVESGVHNSLIAANGVYRRLHDMQFRDADGV